MELEERLKKLLKLSERGIDGEKEAATKILNNLMKKYNITEEQLKSKSVDWYKFRVHNDWEMKLLFQTVYKVLGYGSDGKYIKKSKTTYLFELTLEESIEIEYIYSIYKQDLKKEIDLFYQAFISKNNLFPDNAPKASDDEPIDFKKAIKLQSFMSGIDNSNIHKALK